MSFLPEIKLARCYKSKLIKKWKSYRYIDKNFNNGQTNSNNNTKYKNQHFQI